MIRVPLLPFAMFGVAVSFFTLVAAGHTSEAIVWAYATTMVVLTVTNLAWERVRHSR